MADSSRSPTPPSPPSHAEQIAALERQLRERTQQLAEATSRPKRKITVQTMGRGVRRLVSCFDSILTITGEADRRMLSEDHDSTMDESDLSVDDREELTRTQDRLFTAFTLLVQLVPQTLGALKDPEVSTIQTFAAQLQDGANAARSDDIRHIRAEVTTWLRSRCGPMDQLDPKSRNNRGLQHDVCGLLLCPIEVDWNNPQTRDDIRNGTSTFNINDSFFLRCLYPLGTGDPENVEEGFLRGSLLLMTFRTIFASTSPTDLDETDNLIPHVHRASKRATRADVASILKMDGRVTGRSIAYAAVILVFNLTDAVQWTEVYNGFNFHAFYNFLVDYFEVTPTPGSKQRVQLLLRFWNRSIFPDRAAVSDNRASYKKLASQRARSTTSHDDTS